jgi:hypothetical protein
LPTARKLVDRKLKEFLIRKAISHKEIFVPFKCLPKSYANEAPL